VGLEPLLSARDIGEPEGPERRGHAAADEAAAEFGQFHRRAADVADHPVGAGPAEQHALRRQPRLLVAVDDPEAEAGLPLDLLPESGTVLRLPHRCRGDHRQRRGAHAFGQKLEALQRREGTGFPFGLSRPVSARPARGRT
jgi:hypothetical protein